MSFHVVGWVSLVMLLLILKFMLLLVLVVISILKVLTIQTFDLRSVFETMNWNKVSGKVTRWWTVWSQSCEILKLLPVFLEVFPFFLTPISFLCKYAYSSYLSQPPQPRSVGLFWPFWAKKGHILWQILAYFYRPKWCGDVPKLTNKWYANIFRIFVVKC